MSKKKKKLKWKQILLIILIPVVSFCVGLLIGKVSKPVLGEIPPKDFYMGLLGFYVFFVLFSYVQIVVHEAGHLIFGLLTGYKFSSFRIGSLMWVKADGKLKLKRYSLTGTGGQCLMAPPDLINGKVPYVLYNLGGCIANITVSVILLVLVLPSWKLTYANCMVLLWSVIGLYFAVINGVPMKIQGMPNDGHNAMELGKHPDAMRAFWLQMKINEQIALGKRLKELPEEWFELPDQEGMQNSMVVTIAVFHCSRLMDQGKYAEAYELMRRLLSEKSGMVGIHRRFLTAECICCEIIGDNRKEQVEEFSTEEEMKFLKSMKKSPSAFRTQYLYAKYVEQDEMKAEKAMIAFEKVSATYPYPNELESDREVLAYAEKRFGE